MRSKHILIVLSVIAALTAVAVVVSAGDPDTPPGPPETTSSYTLEHIYDRLSTGAAGAQITFTEPISGPPPPKLYRRGPTGACEMEPGDCNLAPPLPAAT